MAWNLFPLNAASGFSYKAAYNELMLAYNERYKTINENELATWPPGVTPWEIFIIQSVDASGLVVTALSDEFGDPINWPVDRWANYVPDPGFEYIPEDYDLCIYTGEDVPCEQDDPRTVTRTNIVSNTSGTITLSSSLLNQMNANVFPSIASLANKYAWIIKREAGDLSFPFWHNRWRPGFNDGSYWTIDTGFSCTSGLLTFNLHSYDRDIVTNEFVGKYLFGNNTNGIFDKLQITANTSGTQSYPCQVSFTNQPSGFAFTSSVAIYNSSTNRYWPLDLNWHGLLRWYGGAMDSWMNHGADGSLQYSCPIAATTIPMDLIDDIDALDLDAHTQFDETDAEADEWFAPYFYTGVRSMQASLETFCNSWTEDIDYDGTTDIHNLTTAEAFDAAGINSFSTSAVVGDTISGQVDFSISLPSHGYGTDVYYAVLTEREAVIFSGTMADQSSTAVSFTVGSQYDGDNFTLIYSWGWSRLVPKRMLALYDKSIFFPDYDEEDPPVLQDPPTEAFPGYWETYSKSTEFAEYDERGFLIEGYGSFTNGEKAIYTGDNKYTGNILGFTAEASPDPSDYNLYINYGAFGDLPLASQLLHDASLTGTITSGNHRYLEDNTKDWWDPIWHSEQLGMPVHTGNATAGSLTTLSDNTKIGNGYWNEATGRFFDFIVVLTSGVNAGLRVPCTDFDDTTATLTFRDEYLGAAIQAGDGYEIREPTSYELNKWQDRQLILYTASGTSYTTKILYSDDKSLHFEEIAEPVQPGWTYRINDIRVGHTVVKTSDGWEEAVKPQATEPDHLTRYGKHRRGDYGNATLLNEIYQFLNILTASSRSASYRSREDPDIEEFNSKQSFSFYICADPHAGTCCSETRADGQIVFDAEPPIEEDPAFPRIAAGTAIGGAGNFTGKTITYGYAPLNLQTCASYTADLYIYSTISAADPDEINVPGVCGLTLEETSNGAIRDFMEYQGAYFREYKLWDTNSGPTGDEILYPVGDQTLSNADWGDCPNPYIDCDEGAGELQYGEEVSSNGWYAYDSKFVIRYNFNYMTV